MFADTLEQHQRIIEFFGETWDEIRGQKAVELCRFEKRQAKEQEIGFKKKLRDAPGFFNKRKSGR